MSLMVPVALFGWPVLVLVLFYALPGRKAVIVSFIGAWLFLPMAGYHVKFIPSYDKTLAASVAVLLGMLVFDSVRLTRFHFRLPDLFVLGLTIAPFISSVLNGLGVWDGVSVMERSFVSWGLVYFIGRLYFDDLEALRELAMGIAIGGLLYMPLCLWEIRMSPQLHAQVYGFRQQGFAMSLRFGGYRPSVFMQHGLAVAVWMMSATLAILWLWLTGAAKRLLGVPSWIWAIAMVITLVLCKSAGAYVMFAAGALVLALTYFFRSKTPMLVLTAAPVLYIVMSTQGLMPYDAMSELAGQTLGEQRASSLSTRFNSEHILVDRAMDSPLYGWAGHDRWTHDSFGRDLIWGADQFWVITLAKTGLFGLSMWLAVMLVPTWAMWRRIPRKGWVNPRAGPPLVLAMIVTLFLVDCLFNAMPNPVFVLIIGAMVNLPAVEMPQRRSRAAPAAKPRRGKHRHLPTPA